MRVPGSAEYEATLIPDTAVVSDQSRKIVLVVDGEGGVSARVHRRYQQIHRTGRIAARRQHQLAAQRAVAINQKSKPVSDTVPRNVGKARCHDIAKLALGMDIDHADRATFALARHSPAAARSALMVVRGEMASVAVTISTIAPEGAAQARSYAAANSSVRVTRSPWNP